MRPKLASRVQRFVPVSLVVLLIVVVLIASVAAAVNLLFPGPTQGQIAAIDTGDRLIPRIMGLQNGDHVNLARALDVAWERAVLMAAYKDGDEMNDVLGFAWYRHDEWAGSDESQRTLAFTSGRTVVAEVLLSPETFRIDEAVESFEASDAVFVVRRDESGVVFLYRP